MARRRIRNKQPKLKNKQIVDTSFSFDAPQENHFAFYQDLITNPTNLVDNGLTQPNTGYVETIGGLEVNCTLEGASSLNNVSMYLMYLPEGYSTNDIYSFVQQHPEWILAYKYLGSPTDSANGQGCQPIRIRSRFRRNLLTGDRIVMVATGWNSSNTSVQGTIWALVRFSSKIN